ncbi:MAG TPA: DNA recombination protein RmuC, partial [Gammaproteobacteria bacterium]|nr:DNA recombination protein RmuC [Gammaproteobacteria bacterium]
QQLDDRFASLSKTALQHNSDAFLKLAAQSFKSLQVKAESDLEKREQAVANLVTPIQQALDKAEKQIQQIEKERKESFGSITQ